MVFRDLKVVLGLGRLVSGGDATIHPFGLAQKLGGLGELIGREKVGDLQEHGWLVFKVDTEQGGDAGAWDDVLGMDAVVVFVVSQVIDVGLEINVMGGVIFQHGAEGPIVGGRFQQAVGGGRGEAGNAAVDKVKT